MFIGQYYPQMPQQVPQQTQQLQSTGVPLQQQQRLTSQPIVPQQPFQQAAAAVQQPNPYAQFQSAYMPMFSYQSTGAIQPTYFTTPTVETSNVNANPPITTSVDNSAAYANYQHQLLAACAQYGQPSFYYQQPFYSGMVSPQYMSKANRQNRILKQIESYFSPAVLKADIELRKQMNADGYIPLTVIIGLPRVQQLTNDLLMIMRILQRSTELELDAERVKVRPRVDWHLYPLPKKSVKSKRTFTAKGKNNVDETPDSLTPVKKDEKKSIE